MARTTKDAKIARTPPARTSVLSRIAHFRNRRDEVPNQELARDLASRKDRKGVREIAENLRNPDPAVRSDCLKVLYEIGFLDPSLVSPYVGDFLALSRAKNNRLVWGSMIALSPVAALAADEIYRHADQIRKVLETGTVITIDNGVKTLAIVASRKDAYGKALFPVLLQHLERCRPKDVPQHSEKILVAVNARNRTAFVEALEGRLDAMTVSQRARVMRVIRSTGKI